LKKILFVTNSPAPYREDLYNDLSNHCVDENIDFIVVYYRLYEKNRSWSVDLNKSKYKYRLFNSRQYFFGSLDTYLSLNPFFYFLKKNPDIVLLAGAWHYLSNLLILIFCKLSSKKIVFWCESNKYSDKSNLKIIRGIKKLFYKLIDQYILPGNESISYIKKYNNKFEFVIAPNSVSNKFLSNEYHYVNNKDMIFVGELCDRKGIMAICHSLISLGASLPQNFTFYIVGDGKHKDSILKLCQQYKFIEYLGYLDYELLISYFRKVNSVILHTSLDPSPLVVNESIVLGKIPIVSNRAGNSSDCIIDDFSNFVYEYDLLTETLEGYFASPHDSLMDYSKGLFQLKCNYVSENISKNICEFILKND